MSARACRSCGYQVLSTVATACPECGEPLPTMLVSSGSRALPALAIFVVAGAIAGKVGLDSLSGRGTRPAPPPAPAVRPPATVPRTTGATAPATRVARADPATAAQIRDLQSADAAHRQAAAEALAGSASGEAVRPLAVAATRDREANVRRLAVAALAGIGRRATLAPEDRAAAAAALRAGLKDREEAVRSEAALAVGQTGDTAAAPALRPLLRDNSADVRRTAALALGRLHDAASVDALVGALTDPEVGYYASDALGRIATPRAQQVLMAAYDRRDFARMAGAAAFYARGKPPAYEKVLIDLLHDRKDLAVAQDLILSKDPKLAGPARAWAAAQGFVLASDADAPEGVTWQQVPPR